MIHSLPEETIYDGPHEFTDPFRYVPHPAVRKAAELTIRQIESDPALSSAFSEGKMLGILICKPSCFLAAFSGNVGGRSTIKGFVPPIYDLLKPEGHFKIKEAEISRINRQIQGLSNSPELKVLKNGLLTAEQEMNESISKQKARMAVLKARRDEIRHETSGPYDHASLIKESQFEKAELRRLRTSWEEKISRIKEDIDNITQEADRLKSLRARMSDELQDWIFRQYIVHNALGEEASIADIFSKEGIIPPGGTGECAAPKLLEYAYRHGLEPLAMGEFWYGKSPETAVRTHGHFYPSCTSKCGPLLKFMMKGLRHSSLSPWSHSADRLIPDPIIVHEDRSIIAIEKPSGMPSVPGLDGRQSLQEWLDASLSIETHPVHRLDMDTSGIMIFAKTPAAAVDIRRQFEEHTIRKTYIARIKISDRLPDAEGHIDLPLSPDYDERPRQKVDLKQGKEAHTDYEIIKENQDSTAEILLHPRTGRTHQLRVHCAHSLGLASPIIGDLLYGAYTAGQEHATHQTRLCLHALSITFRHPENGSEISFTSSQLSY